MSIFIYVPSFLSLDIAKKIEDAAENINMEVVAILMEDQQQIYFGKLRQFKKKYSSQENSMKREVHLKDNKKN